MSICRQKNITNLTPSPFTTTCTATLGYVNYNRAVHAGRVIYPGPILCLGQRTNQALGLNPGTATSISRASLLYEG